MGGYLKTSPASQSKLIATPKQEVNNLEMPFFFFSSCLLTTLPPRSDRRDNHNSCHSHYKRMINQTTIILYFVNSSAIVFTCCFLINSPEICSYSRISKQEGPQSFPNPICFACEKTQTTVVRKPRLEFRSYFSSDCDPRDRLFIYKWITSTEALNPSPQFSILQVRAESRMEKHHMNPSSNDGLNFPHDFCE